jgi:hypothetical protein
MRIELESVCQLVGETVNPLRHSSEVFAHYSIPAYDAGQGPVLEPGASILSNKIEFPAGSILVSKLNPRISRVWLVTDNRVQRRFLIEAFKHMGGRLGERATGADVTAMGSSRLYGREKGEPDLSDRARKPRAARDRLAEPLAWQHPRRP